MSTNDTAAKVAIVTGGASGIGLAFCEALEASGTRAIVADIAGATPIDVRDFEQVNDLVQKTRRDHGRLDYMFNNAGIGVFGEVRDYQPGDWQNVFDVNLTGVVHGVRAAYPVMIEQGFGHIVNVASVAGLVPFPGCISYTTSKHAVVGMSLALRAEATLVGVKVSVVCPGWIETPIYTAMEQRGFEIKDVNAFMREQTPLFPTRPSKVARDVLRGLRRNQAVIISPFSARFIWWTWRYAPWLVQWQSRIALRKLQAFRSDRNSDTVE